MDREELGKVYRNLPILIELRDSEEGLTQTEIGRRLDYPKSTTHRKTSWLEEREVLRETGSGYELTDLGRFITEQVEGCLSKVENAVELRGFVSVVSESELRFGDIEDGTVVKARDGNPLRPLTHLTEIIDRSEEAHVLTKSMAPRGFTVGGEALKSENTAVELVVDSDITDSEEISEWYGDGIKNDLETGRLNIWMHDNVKYDFGIADGRLCLGSENGSRIPEAVLETTDDYAVSWAHDELKKHKQAADRLTASDF